MSMLKALELATNKTQFLLIRLNLEFYQCLSEQEPDYQSQLAQTTIAEWIHDNKVPYDLILNLLSFSRFLHNGKLFGEGESDFLLQLIKQLVIVYDNDKLLNAHFITDYQPNPNVSSFFHLVEQLIAQRFNFALLKEFSQAIIRQVFIPIIAAKLPQSSTGTESSIELEAITADAERCADFLTRLTGRTESAEFIYNPALEPQRLIKDWENRLTSGELDCSLLQSFQTACETVFIGGKDHRLTRHHAAIAKTINCYSEHVLDADEAIERILEIDSLFRQTDYEIIEEEKSCQIL